MEKKDLYEILGVSKSATQDEIKTAYRKLAMKLHPDRNRDNPEEAENQFKEVKAAYDILSDKNKRAHYDHYGHDGAMGGAGGFSGGGAHFSDVFGDIFGDIFGGRAGGGARRHGPNSRPGRDLSYELVLTLEEAINGCKKELCARTLGKCDSCSGTGKTEKSLKHTCKVCNGMGQVRVQQGFFSIAQPCSECSGYGQIIENPCPDCRGSGRVHKAKNLEVNIPAGVDTGDRIRLQGEGEAGEQGAPAGDMFVSIQVSRHDIFNREGDDLHCAMPISFVTAALGGEIEVPTLGGRVMLTIPAETQTGRTFRLRGKGVKSVRSRDVGDLYCTVNIETPVNLSKEQRELLQEFGNTLVAGGKNHAPKESNFFANVKKFFENL